MLVKNNPEDPVFQFLAGTFHQDADSTEEALQELLTEESKEYLKSAIVFLTEFINSEYSDDEKNEYIQHCADGVYFPDLELTPIQWLKSVVEQLKEAVKAE
ncbi:contact-dependent growth inhibition system immunity protein [Aeribacillus composti]|uniref:contact-dependent growth inhibition system immunity protein n=1 Tax=Aeribacillus composti TaxID=1868734 RepID=UPI002E1DA07F|nr:contact-dependent growth inhibition system immunity protein [Aeribacillus composti]MED0746706.1 contact-dependent growth inhibition system immunity protein [Aeribacillus composti]